MERHLSKQHLLVEKKLLTENWIENTLMVAGFIPVIGEVADIVLILYYCYKKEWLYAGLMLIALIPTVGDFIAKPIIAVFKSPVAKGALKSTDDLVKFLKTNPKIMEQYMKLGKHLDNQSLKVLLKQVREVSPTFARKLETSLLEHKSVFGKLLEKPKGIVHAIGHEGKIGAGINRFFKEEKLFDYITKRGQVPSNWLSKWYNITYLGNRAKRQYIRNFIMANNLLAALGIPSLTDFEERMGNPEDLEKFSKNPAFSKMVGETTSGSELNQIEGGQSVEDGLEAVENEYGGQFGMNFLKMMAQKYV
jgi:hypothetical protein